MDLDSHLYVPAGADALIDDPEQAARTLDLINAIGTSHEGTPINAIEYRGRYLMTPGGRKDKRHYYYDLVRDDLIARPVIETDGSYKPEKLGKGPGKNKKYRLTSEWAAKPLIRRPATHDFNKRVKASALPVPPWLRYCVDRVSFDLAAAIAWILQDTGVSADEAAEIVAACDFPRGTCEGHDRIGAAIHRVAPHLTPLVGKRISHLWRWRIDGTLRSYSRDESGHRLHTPISNMAGEFRPFIGLGGTGPMYEIDARNSQPTLVAALAVRELGTHDAKQLAGVCGRGEFYEDLYEYTNNGRELTPAERPLWKETVFGTVVYGTPKSHDSRIGKAFARAYPTVSKWIIDYKTENGTGALPCAMQKQEAKIWVDGLAPELESRNIRAVTIHDSVLVHEADRDTVHRLVQDLYDAEGIAAKLEPRPVAIEPLGTLQLAYERVEREKAERARMEKQRATIKRAVAKRHEGAAAVH